MTVTPDEAPSGVGAEMTREPMSPWETVPPTAMNPNQTNVVWVRWQLSWNVGRHPVPAACACRTIVSTYSFENLEHASIRAHKHVVRCAHVGHPVAVALKPWSANRGRSGGSHRMGDRLHGMFFRQTPGVVPVLAMKTLVKWLWSSKPACRAMAASG